MALDEAISCVAQLMNGGRDEFRCRDEALGPLIVVGVHGWTCVHATLGDEFTLCCGRCLHEGLHSIGDGLRSGKNLLVEGKVLVGLLNGDSLLAEYGICCKSL